MKFADAGTQWRFGTEPDVSHASAAADLDDDGDLDVVVNRLGSPALLLRSESPAPRVAVRLVGDTPNTQAVGAKIKLIGGLKQPIRRAAVGILALAAFLVPAPLATAARADRDDRTSVITLPGATGAEGISST